RDRRNYADDSDLNKLSRAEFAWSLNVDEVSKALAARRNTRQFAQFLTDSHQEGSPKDVLTGKEEVIGSEAMWEKTLPEFTDKERSYGAITIVKRLWSSGADCYLASLLDESQRKSYLEMHHFESTESIAEKNDNPRNYVAILAMDGDEMGKWMNGDKAPALVELLEEAPKEYFKRNITDYESIKRPLSPGYHAQFSEMLTNFTARIAGRVVAEFDGELIYAGGDDVLAMLPMDKALPCASALRELFQGRVPEGLRKYWQETNVNGFLREVDSCGVAGAYLIVPGERADLSCGIAIGHQCYPLQHLVQAARLAEERAKKHYERGAVAVSALKRSGEIIHWGTKWDINGNQLLGDFTTLVFGKDNDKEEKFISGRFAYALAQLCAPYELHKVAYSSEAMLDVIKLEFEHVCSQQTDQKKAEVKKFKADALKYFADEAGFYAVEEPKVFCNNFINLFLLASFIGRPGEGDK
ncbi:MAG: type III-B CRISPR-associated protein Cas10/Cmr2, partial [Victivallaceae bacterium]